MKTTLIAALLLLSCVPVRSQVVGSKKYPYVAKVVSVGVPPANMRGADKELKIAVDGARYLTVYLRSKDFKPQLGDEFTYQMDPKDKNNATLLVPILKDNKWIDVKCYIHQIENQ